MPLPVRILAFAGSARRESLNRRLLIPAAAAAREAGGEVTVVDLREFEMPLYDGDLEASRGLPEGALRLKRLFLEHDALLLASPEHNSGISSLMKNTIDWVSRAAPGEKPLACFAGKTAALLAASPGVLGGLRGLMMLRSILSNIGVLVLPDQVAVPKADGVLDAAGTIQDASIKDRVRAAAAKLVVTASKLRA